MQIPVIAYTKSEANKTDNFTGCWRREKKTEKIYFCQFYLLIRNLQLENREKNTIKKKILEAVRGNTGQIGG